MKIVVFGASGGVGMEVVRQALQSGHIVTAFVRSPGKFTTTHPNLTVFEGDSMDAEAVSKAIAGQEAVISTLGPTRPPVPHMMKISAQNIVAGMKNQGIRRLVQGTGARFMTATEFLKTAASPTPQASFNDAIEEDPEITEELKKRWL